MTSSLRRALPGSWWLTALAVVSAMLAVASAVGIFADDRILIGQPIWLKPFKFGVSFAIYSLTLGWLIAHIRRGRRTASVTAAIISIAGIVELAIIVGQVVRGRPSHYNISTPLDEALWQAMGNTIVILWLGTAIVAIMLWRDGLGDRSKTWAVRLGLIIMLFGLAEGFLMTAQSSELTDGAHSVGVPDGGPGMPLTGWSTTGGDLRIGHFVGMHALQALLIFSMVLPRFVKNENTRTKLVFLGAAIYSALFVLVTVQALNGQPLLGEIG